ncbi:MAG: alpha/beta fold hydrolase [Pseudomonadota bacterium]|jgi:pimeloyl-ACP methyl ester carboxylesterase|nr:MAG: esterase [Pseudomonadota bacterium]
MHRRNLILGAAAALAAGCTRGAAPAAQAGQGPAGGGLTFLVAHGAWSAGWSWKKMHPLMNAAGHRLLVPTYTGLGEREHLASRDVDIETHISDVLGVIKFEELDDFVLVAHSYGGLVATAVADRVPERIRKLIYVDAFVPRDGQSLFDLVPDPAREQLLSGMAAGDGWRVPPMPIPEDTSPEDVAWIQRFRMPQPLHCFDRPVKLSGEIRVPRAYVYALRRPPADTFGPFAARAREEGWAYREIDASHSPQVTAPETLMEVLVSLAS